MHEGSLEAKLCKKNPRQASLAELVHAGVHLAARSRDGLLILSISRDSREVGQAAADIWQVFHLIDLFTGCREHN